MIDPRPGLAMLGDCPEPFRSLLSAKYTLTEDTGDGPVVRFTHRPGDWDPRIVDIDLTPYHAAPALLIPYLESRLTSAALGRRLRAAEGLTEILMSSSADCIKLLDSDGQLTAINPPGLNVMEIDDFEAVRGANWVSFWEPATRPRVRDALATVLDGGEARFQAFCATYKGSPRWWDVVVTPLRDADGEIAGAVASSRDVTDLLQAERERLELERRFETLADNIPQLAWMAGTDGRTFWINRRWVEFTGLPADMPVETRRAAVLHPDHSDRVQARFQECFQSEEPWEDTFPLRSADGQFRWFLSRATPIRDAEGRVTLWLGTNTDVTAQIEAENAERRSRERLEAALAASDTGTFLWDPTADRFEADAALERLLGGAPETLAELSARVHADDRPELERQFRGGAIDLELRIASPDGRFRWLAARARRTAGEGATLTGAFTDITERKRANEVLRLVADSLPDLVWSTRADGHADYFNRRWPAFTGLPIEQLQGEGWSALLHPDDVEPTLAAWRGAVANDGPYEVEYRLRRHDGVYRWFIGRGVAQRDTGGRPIRWFGTTTDIDDQKRAEAQIEALNARLRRAMIETHHRVKNNLQMITALIELHGAASDADPAIFESLGHNVRALGVIHDILTHEARDSGEAHAISSLSLLERLITVIQSTAGPRRITVDLTDVRLRGRAASSLALVANEMIANALKHGKGDVVVAFTVAGRTATLAVRDDGDGFPDGFDPISAASTGLELIHNIAQFELRGDVRFENHPDGGGHVRLTFDIARADALQ